MPNAMTDAKLEMKRATYWATAVSALLMIIKFYAYFVTHSQAIFSDAVESIVNVITALAGIFVIQFATQPADQDHPYGHGKVEYFSAAFEGGMITVAALVICFEALVSLTEGQGPKQLDEGLYFMIAAGLGNLALGYFLLRTGRKTKSLAIVASGHHMLSDFWTTFAVGVGLILVMWLRISWIDSVCAMVVAIFLAFTGIRLVGESVSGLLDAEDKHILKTLLEIIAKDQHPGIIQIHHCRIMRAGSYHHIDAHAVVPEFWDVSLAHVRTQEFERRMIAQYPYDGELHLHMDPCRRAYCKVCDLADCPIRAAKFEKKLEPNLPDLVSPEEPWSFRIAGSHPAQ